MAGLWAEMRPYLALWRPAMRLARGTWALLGRLTAMCTAGEGSDRVWRALGLLCAAEVGRRIADQAPMVMLPVTALWLVLAWRAGPAWTPPTPASEHDQPAEPAAPEPQLPDPGQLLAALHELADPHVHLSVLAARLGTTTGAVRAALDEAAVPVAGGVRAGGRVSTGVRAADIPPLPDPTPTDPGAVVVAGQPSNNNTDSRRPYLSREGYLTTPDPARPHGWHVSQGR